MDLKNYKHEIYNGLVLTSNSSDMIEITSDFIQKVTGYKPKLSSILLVDETKFVCPMLCIYKSLIYINKHAFSFDESMFKLLQLAKDYKEQLMAEKIFLENWENNWIEILENILNRKNEAVLHLLLRNAEENPNDLLALKVGQVLGLYSGDKEFLDKYSNLFFRFEPNHKNANFLGLYSFILEELKRYEESEKWIKIGMEIDPFNIWLEHNLAHVMYATDRIDESIQFLESQQNKWEEHANFFIKKHIKWHLAIALMEEERYNESDEIIENICTYEFEEAECPLAILGYILRKFIRQDSFSGIKQLWVDILISYFKNYEIYTKHLLFDCMAIWLIDYCVCNKVDSIQLNSPSGSILLEECCQKIESNIKYLECENKEFFQVHFMNILDGMKCFAEGKHQEALQYFLKAEDKFFKIGASDEQMFVLFEIELFLCMKCKDKENFNRIVNDVFGKNLEKLLYIKKLKEYINC
jgi:hypothetical protein